MKDEPILAEVRSYYNDKLKSFGTTPKGVDWNSPEAQRIRFEQLLKVCNPTEAFSINDYGCGYGALVDFLMEKKYVFDYYGFDISNQMISKAVDLHTNKSNCNFTSRSSRMERADYTVASGIFNVRLQTSTEKWKTYVLKTLDSIANLSNKGFAFNVLTKYSDPEYMRSDLFYADPLFLFDYCKKNYSRYIALLHDYPLYEFTILVKKLGE